MQPTGTHLAYYLTCKRKLWLFHNQIQMEHESELVEEGKLIAETTYLDRSRKYTELAIGPIKIDHYDKKNKVIHEVKKSNKLQIAHKAQVWYYIYILEQAGIQGVTAILEYPKLKQTELVVFDDEARSKLEQWIDDVKWLINSEECPPLEKKSICKSCSYFEFCYSGEVE